MISKYLGDTAKHIRLAFERATHHGAALFLDEADSLLYKRVGLGESCATSINQNRNTLMQELDRFEGVVIMTTNLFGNYDEGSCSGACSAASSSVFPTSPCGGGCSPSTYPTRSG